MRRKRIVAMALALSVFASTFGTLGAAAEDAGALPEAKESSITVVAVPLDGSENQSPTPPPERN